MNFSLSTNMSGFCSDSHIYVFHFCRYMYKCIYVLYLSALKPGSYTHWGFKYMLRYCIRMNEIKGRAHLNTIANFLNLMNIKKVPCIKKMITFLGIFLILLLISASSFTDSQSQSFTACSSCPLLSSHMIHVLLMSGV